MSRPIHTVIVSATGIILACFAGFTWNFRNHKIAFAQTPSPNHLVNPKIAPFFVEAEEFAAVTGSAPRLTAKYVFAQSESGGTARTTTTFNSEGSVFESSRELWMAGGVHAEISDHLKLVSATRIASARGDQLRLGRLWDPAKNCSVTFDGATKQSVSSVQEQMLGQSAVKIEEDSSSVRITKFLSPSLGCAELGQKVEFKAADGSITDVNERRAVRVRSGEPDPALFEWPISYSNVSPSERYLRAIEKCNCLRDERTLAALRKEDSTYAAFKFVK